MRVKEVLGSLSVGGSRVDARTQNRVSSRLSRSRDWMDCSPAVNYRILVNRFNTDLDSWRQKTKNVKEVRVRCSTSCTSKCKTSS